MSKPTDVRIAEVQGDRQKFAYRSPMKFGGRVVNDVTVQRAIVKLECPALKKTAHGIGEMTLGTAGHGPVRSSPLQVSRIVLALCDRVLAAASSMTAVAHPIELGIQLRHEARSIANQLADQMKLPEPIPDLAVLLACSPVDAAIHDGFGRLHEKSSLKCWDQSIWMDLSRWLGDEFVGVTLDQHVLPKPKMTLSLYPSCRSFGSSFAG